MSARPYQVGDRVLITGWGTLGPREGTIIQIDPADPHGRFGPYIVTNGPDGTGTCSMNADVTGPEEGDRHTVELIEPAPTNPSGGAVTSTPAPSGGTITLTLDGATMERHTSDPDLDDLYAAGWAKVTDPHTAVVDAALAWDDVVRTGNGTAITVAAELLRGAVAGLRAEVAR